jgi:mRNA interferase RelE/StbE
VIRYKILFAPTALKQLQKFDRSVQIRLCNAIAKLGKDPFLGKQLKGELKDYRSYRVGNYRVIYLVRHRKVQVEIINVAHRREVYK